MDKYLLLFVVLVVTRFFLFCILHRNSLSLSSSIKEEEKTPKSKYRFDLFLCVCVFFQLSKIYDERMNNNQIYAGGDVGEEEDINTVVPFSVICCLNFCLVILGTKRRCKRSLNVFLESEYRINA